MEKQILEKLKKLNLEEKQYLFFKFISSNNHDSIQIKGKTFQSSTKVIIKAFIDSDIDVNIKTNFGESVLFGVKSKEIAELLIQAGAEVNIKNEFGNTPLHRQNDKNIIEFLIESGADSRLKNNNNQTPAEFHRLMGFHDLADFIEQKAIEFEQKQLTQNLPQSSKNKALKNHL